VLFAILSAVLIRNPAVLIFEALRTCNALRQKYMDCAGCGYFQIDCVNCVRSVWVCTFLYAVGLRISDEHRRNFITKQHRVLRTPSRMEYGKNQRRLQTKTMRRATVCLRSPFTITGCAMTLELVVGLTLRKTILVEFVVDKMAVRQIFSWMLWSPMSVYFD
jgi:hypothetical protein